MIVQRDYYTIYNILTYIRGNEVKELVNIFGELRGTERIVEELVRKKIIYFDDDVWMVSYAYCTWSDTMEDLWGVRE